MCYSALDISKYIIGKCTRERHAISNLQLQKILYYIQRAFLRIDSEAFSDDFEAWQFGPVVPSIYNQYCSYGGMPIRILYNVDINDYYKDIINPIVEEKRKLDPWKMVDDIHRPGKAWDQIYRNGTGNHQEIPKWLIQEEAEP